MQDTPFVRVLLSREGPVWSTVTLAYRDTPTNGVSYTGGAILRGPVLPQLHRYTGILRQRGYPVLVVPSWESPGTVHSYSGVQEYFNKEGILHAGGAILVRSTVTLVYRDTLTKSILHRWGPSQVSPSMVHSYYDVQGYPLPRDILYR